MNNEKFKVLISDETQFARISIHNITFKHCKTNKNPKRYQRGSYNFLLSIKQVINDEIHIKSITVLFQPDNSKFFLYHTFISDNRWDERKKEITNALNDEAKIIDESLLDSDIIKSIKKFIIKSIGSKEYWTLDRRGNPFYQLIKKDEEGNEMFKIGRLTFLNF